jgi:hypothetical protein
MVNYRSRAALHPVEAKLVACLEAGNEPSVIGLGGVEAIADAANMLALSPAIPELLTALLRYWVGATDDEQAMLGATLRTLVEGTSVEYILMEAVDVLDAHRPLPDKADEICFTIFLGKAARSQANMSGLARAAALEGAFRWATSNRRWQLRLLDFLLGVSRDDDPIFLSHAAKIIGVAYSHWREPDLIQILTQMIEVEAARADASFELAMATLADALDALDHEAAQALLQAAKVWFDLSASTSETNPEAVLYGHCLALLTEFGAGLDSHRLGELRDRVRVSAFEMTAWHKDDNSPPWLGSRRTESVCWTVLANTLTELAKHLEETSWWEPAAIIEQYVLAAYTAGRSILQRRRDGSLKALLRPRITASIAKREGQAYVVKTWLRLNTSHEWAGEAQDLLNKIDELVEREKQPQNPSEAATGGRPVVALIDKACLPAKTKARLLEVISNAFSLQLDNLTYAEVEVIEKCLEFVESHPDHRGNPHGQRLFDTVLLWTVRFLCVRLEVTQKDDPTGGYLFERTDGTLAHEDELQADFFRWLTTNASGSDLEPMNLGGGRADVRLQSSSERLVIEVKRELCDSSFDALAGSYAAQTTDYQNVSIRLGFLLVLDLAIANREGTPHITSLVQTRSIQRAGEETPRVVTIVRVPGRRKRPSDLTKLAKTKRT